MRKMMTMTKDMVIIGKVGAAVGIRGEVRLIIFSYDFRNIIPGKTVFLSKNGNEERHQLEKVRIHKGKPAVMLSGISDRTSAEALTGMDIMIAEEDLEELEDGVYYVRDLIGMAVFDVAQDDYGRLLGRIKDVIQGGAQPLYVVERPRGTDILIPAVDKFIKKIDVKNRRMEVELIPGFA